MYTRQAISVGNLLLDPGNSRIVKQESQKATRDAIITEQNKKLIVLAKDIIENGLNPCDLPLVFDAGDGNQNYFIIEGNRRLTAIQLMLNPGLAEGTPIHAAFKKLNKDHADSIPKVFECVIVPSKKAGAIWMDRKHASGLEGAGTEPWSAISKARADAENGFSRPELDAVNFVLTNPDLDQSLRKVLEGSEFNITNMKRLVETKEFQQETGITLQDGKLISNQSKDRIREIFTEIAKVIATSKKPDGAKFTVLDIHSKGHREAFIHSIIAKHPKKKKADAPWVVSGKPVKATIKTAKSKSKTTPSTDEQPNLIPKSFKLELPAGKINDIFVELKHLDVMRCRHAISVLFRVFFEFTLDDYIKKQGIQLPTDKNGYVSDKLSVRLDFVKKHVKSTKLLSEKEMKPVDVATANQHSLLSPETLNAYVHSPWMNPDPMQLKLTWAECQLFIERLWKSENKAGQPT